MEVTIQKRGSVHGIRIPKLLLDALGLKEKDRIELTQVGERIIISKKSRKHRSLENRLSEYYKKPIGEIWKMDNEELSWGCAQGNEVW